MRSNTQIPLGVPSIKGDVLTGDSQVVMSDGSCKALKDLKPGDRLACVGGQTITVVAPASVLGMLKISIGVKVEK